MRMHRANIPAIHQGHTKRCASGPGSIHAEAEMRQLVQAGKTKEAIHFFHEHHDSGYRPMTWGRAWYLEQTR